MRYRISFLLCALLSSLGIYAQTTDSLRVLQQDNASYTFTESQLGEDQDANQNVISVMSSKDDLFSSMAGYTFSPMRFSVRGFDSKYNDVYLNGVRFNNPELGRFNYGGVIGGLNDATRNYEGIIGLKP